jgi:phage portal protein BeeE
VGRTAEALSQWLAAGFGESLRLGYDVDHVEALSQEREALWARIEGSRFLTVNEKRAAVGYGPVPGGDRLGDGGGLSGPSRRPCGPPQGEVNP